jgi:hypothetical protein
MQFLICGVVIEQYSATGCYNIILWTTPLVWRPRNRGFILAEARNVSFPHTVKAASLVYSTYDMESGIYFAGDRAIVAWSWPPHLPPKIKMYGTVHPLLHGWCLITSNDNLTVYSTDRWTWFPVTGSIEVLALSPQQCDCTLNRNGVHRKVLLSHLPKVPHTRTHACCHGVYPRVWRVDVPCWLPARWRSHRA